MSKKEMTKTASKYRKIIDEPNMSENTLLLKVEDLIGITFGDVNANIVNFKLLHTILVILARNMRLLEQDVEIRFAEEDEMLDKLKATFGASSSFDGPETQKGRKGSGFPKGKKVSEIPEPKTEKETKGIEQVTTEKDTEDKDTKDKDTKDKDTKDKDTKDKDTKDKDTKDKDTKDKDTKEKDKKDKDTKDKDTKDKDTKEKEEKAKTGKSAKPEKQEEKERKKSVGGPKLAEDSTSTISRQISTFTVGTVSQAVSSQQPTGMDIKRVGSIEVVTKSQFNLLESMVQGLMKMTGNIPMPTMPSNQDLLTELTKGTATLPDTMEAMQVNARIQAAEKGLSKMAELLTFLAASGALPPDIAGVISQMQKDLNLTGVELPESNSTPMTWAKPTRTISTVSTVSKVTGGGGGGVSRSEMVEALQIMQDEILTGIDLMSDKTRLAVELTKQILNSVVDRFDVVKKLDSRITNLTTVTTNYAAQLAGLGEGLNSQLTGFKDQMGQLQSELAMGIVQLQSAGNTKESDALTDLRSGYENLVLSLENVMHTHGAFVNFQKQLHDDLKVLLDTVDMMREQKADRDEVADGLRDKANLSRLKGLLRQTELDATRRELEARLDRTHEKFSKQEGVWMGALQDLTNMTKRKADIVQLLALKDAAERSLNEQMEKLMYLEVLLGEPRTALMTRQMSRNAKCGPCMTPALMDPVEQRAGGPPALPALLRHGETMADKPCVHPSRQPMADIRNHVCKRWVGGSHTMVSEHVTREIPPRVPLELIVPTKKYAGHGDDARLYLMEEELQPCVECNKMTPNEAGVAPSDDGGGDVVVAGVAPSDDGGGDVVVAGVAPSDDVGS